MNERPLRHQDDRRWGDDITSREPRSVMSADVWAFPNSIYTKDFGNDTFRAGARIVEILRSQVQDHPTHPPLNLSKRPKSPTGWYRAWPKCVLEIFGSDCSVWSWAVEIWESEEASEPDPPNPPSSWGFRHWTSNWKKTRSRPRTRWRDYISIDQMYSCQIQLCHSQVLKGFLMSSPLGSDLLRVRLLNQ